MIIGVLGLQGCCVPHEQKFAKLGVPTKRILYPEDLDEVQALVLPGGESTTMLKVRTGGLWEKLLAFGGSKPMWGVCAGCILLAKRVTHPDQTSLEAMDIDVVRNAYGAQNESFVAELPLKLGEERATECVFIRAPVISRVGVGLDVLAWHDNEPVMVENHKHLVTTFHPELTESTAVHEYFLEKVGRA